ncbi:MAG: cob(I)yrinic acid a,c-diamide adenosyltransferase [Actinomycetota bacterium]
MPRIYTKTGDDGTTGLLYGGRVSKDDIRTEAYGTSDEAVAALGLARAETTDAELKALLLRLQRELFVAGAELATENANHSKLTPGATLITAGMVESLESVIDDYVSRTQMPKEFVIPGETRGSAAIDLARAIVRRCEREVTTMTAEGLLPDGECLRYLNRLADLLFVLARYEEKTFTPLHVAD